MIISRTPLRVSFSGGGSDVSSFFSKETGAVISTAINKYIYITVNKKFDSKIRISYSKTEIVDNVSKIKHELIKRCLEKVGIKGGIEITSIADIPSEGTGLGSSSAYIVGLLNALYAFQGKHSSAERLAKEAYEIETNEINSPIGKQDHYIAAYGGFKYIEFNPDESVYVNPVIMSFEKKKKLEENLLLFFTGLTRSSLGILKKQKKAIEKNDKKEILRKMIINAKKMKDLLSKNDINGFGRLAHESWVLKKSVISEISHLKIDEWYKTALKNGAIGGKICGAGGGGFLLLYAPKKRHENIKKSLSHLKLMDFCFEPQGSKIIYVEE